MRYALPFSKHNYDILKASKHYIGGGHSYEYLKQDGYTGTVYVTFGEMHGSKNTIDDFLSTIRAERYKIPKFKLKASS